MWHIQRLKSNIEGQLDGGAGRLCDMPVLDTHQPGVLLEGTKEPRLRSSQRAVKVKESERTEICGRAHHRMLHGSNWAYAEADFG